MDDESNALVVIPPDQQVSLPNEKAVAPPTPEGKRYLTRFLPGDIVHCRSGLIAQIHEAKVVYQTPSGIIKHLHWNFRAGLLDKIKVEKIIGEKYSLSEIPGHPMNTQGWVRIGEFDKVICGPLHDVLGGKSGLVQITEEDRKREKPDRDSTSWLTGRRHGEKKLNSATTVYRLGG